MAILHERFVGDKSILQQLYRVPGDSGDVRGLQQGGDLQSAPSNALCSYVKECITERNLIPTSFNRENFKTFIPTDPLLITYINHITDLITQPDYPNCWSSINSSAGMPLGSHHPVGRAYGFFFLAELIQREKGT